VKALASQIYEAVRSGKLAEPLTPETVKRACPGWSDTTYKVFMNKHRVGNTGGQTELFVRIGPGQFKLRNSN
jgi:hypothetical protein